MNPAIPDFVCYGNLAGRCAGCGSVLGIIAGGYRCSWHGPPYMEAVVCADCYQSIDVVTRIYQERLAEGAPE